MQLLPLTLQGDLRQPNLDRDAAVDQALDAVGLDYVTAATVEVARPRSLQGEPQANRDVAEWIRSEFHRFGLSTEVQGQFRNVIGLPEPGTRPRVLICAHYDSVPGSPGADDNASGVAAMLASACALARRVGTVAWVAFNAEEDGLRGSRDLVASALADLGWEPEVVHVLEMVGFTAIGPGSQRIPPALPVRLPEDGDFIGILANGRSAPLAQEVRRIWARYLPGFPTQTLTIRFGLERVFADLLRSDHVPFWDAGVPALLWTDTANFRNPHYHMPTDLPGTLNFAMVQAVARALVAHVLAVRRDPREA